MTMTFDSFGAMAVHLTARYEATKSILERGLERVAVRIEKTAQSEFGRYQPARGPFPAWEQLAESTQEQREHLGFTPNDPLFREGQLQASIQHEVHDLEAVIGSGDEVMAYQEFGTSRMPPRPVLGPAAFRNKAAIERILGAAAVSAIIGGDQVHPALGYDFDT